MSGQTPFYLRDDLDGLTAGLDADDKAAVIKFRETGYLVLDLDIDSLPDQIIEGVSYPDDDGRVQDAWRSVEAVKRLALNAEVARVLHLLYGREPFAFQTLNFPVGTQQHTHSDTIHFSSLPADFMAGVWVALEDIDAENGPLHYYPGSHRLPHVTMDELGVSGWRVKGYDLYRSHYEPEIQRRTEGMERAEAHLAKGQALIWSANLLHGGNPILDPARTRHSQVTHYYFRGCRYWTPLQSGEGKRRMRCPFNVETGKSVTRMGDLPIHQGLLRRIPGLS
ncbi:phytanoyl-CoA dioxygenase family protein [Croceicoccus bisphenolivorans]|uniref:phytanoyl-CoA dioxygenase family protein n=1 Tax=Croceicoccus bisphenolivorans TaxID=1783232 RepID=UPI00082CC603|nr:phytanoyl-CoA dioxygenase family protein [Croceicoccus bisphenolivorans]